MNLYGLLLLAAVVFGLVLGYIVGGQAEARTLALVTEELKNIRDEVNGAPGYQMLNPDVVLWVSRTLDRVERLL